MKKLTKEREEKTQRKVTYGNVVLNYSLEVVDTPLAQNLNKHVFVRANAVLAGDVKLHRVLFGQSWVGRIKRALALESAKRNTRITIHGQNETKRKGGHKPEQEREGTCGSLQKCHQ